MAKFRLEINCDNAAFEGIEGREIYRIISESLPAVAIWNIFYKKEKRPLRDINGNVVGYAEYTEGE